MTAKTCPVCGITPVVDSFNRRGFPEREDNGVWYMVRHYCGMRKPTYEIVCISCEAKTAQKAVELWNGYVGKIEAMRTPPFEQMTLF